MWSLFIFLVIIIFKADARGPDNDPSTITFEITTKELVNGREIICDHNIDDIQKNIYTVREGEQLKIIVNINNNNSYISHFLCGNYNKNDDVYNYYKRTYEYLKETTVEKRMGTLWNCTVLTHQNVPTTLPVVQYKGDTYSAAYCYMKIHVRQTNSPQTILVNNMVLQADRTDLSEKDVDFTAEYRYADGDVVNVTCTNFLNTAPLTMEYAMAGTMSDYSIMKDLKSDEAIGFHVKLHSGHNNSYMICTNTESIDYTKVMVRFVMQAEFNTISVVINGMILRPQLKNDQNNHYDIEYKYPSDQHINVVCEVQRTDMNLVVVDVFDFAGKVSSYKKKELIPTKKAEMSFSLQPKDDKKLVCVSNYIHGANVEQLAIHFTAGKFPSDQYMEFPSLHMELPSNGTVMELYSGGKLKIILYEFKDGEIIQLKCGPLVIHPNWLGSPLNLQIKDFGICNQDGCAISKTLHVTRKDENTEIACSLEEKPDGLTSLGKKQIKVVREIRVILRERFFTTTTTTTTTNTNIATSFNRVMSTTNPKTALISDETSNNLVYRMSAVAVAVTVAVFIVILIYLSVKKCSCCIGSSSQELPAVPTPRPEPAGINYYENMLAIFKPINDREAAEMEPQYEEIQ